MWHYAFRGEPEPGLRAIRTGDPPQPQRYGICTFWVCVACLVSTTWHRNYAKAAEIARLAVQRGPRFRRLAHPCRALGQLGDLDEAREALARFLVLPPDFANEQAMRASTAFRDEALFQHFLEGLRKAGWTG